MTNSDNKVSPTLSEAELDPSKTIDVVLKHLSRFDKDTSIFGLVATLTFLSLIFGNNPQTSLFAGFGFIGLYVVKRYALLRVQLREKEVDIKTIPARRADAIIEGTATHEEQIALDKMHETARKHLMEREGGSNDGS